MAVLSLVGTTLLSASSSFAQGVRNGATHSPRVSGQGGLLPVHGVHFQLRRASRRQGALRVEGTPAGAEVYVDGALAGVLPLEEPLPLDPGNHTVRVVSPGFTEFNEVVVIQRRQTERVAAQLLPVSMSLLLITDPERAQVFVDGEFAGETPVTLDLRQGERSIRLRRFGYHENVFQLTAVAGAAETRDISLEPLPAEVLANLQDPPSEWYEEPLPWALIGGGVALVAASVIAVAVLSSDGPLLQEEFCSDVPCAVFEL